MQCDHDAVGHDDGSQAIGKQVGTVPLVPFPVGGNHGHDGVSWNNNLAEYAIKRFACYRKGTVGSLKEDGIADYLTLLSLAHTCRIRGVSFLRFLLSRELDLDSFSTRRGIRRFGQEVDTYPDGFMPTRLAGLEKLKARGKAGHGGT